MYVVYIKSEIKGKMKIIIINNNKRLFKWDPLCHYFSQTVS